MEEVASSKLAAGDAALLSRQEGIDKNKPAEATIMVRFEANL